MFCFFPFMDLLNININVGVFILLMDWSHNIEAMLNAGAKFRSKFYLKYFKDAFFN